MADGNDLRKTKTQLIEELNKTRRKLARLEKSSRPQAEQELRESEARSRAILEALPDLMFRLSREGVYLDYYAPNREALFLPPEKFIGQSVQDGLPPEVADQCLHYIGRTLEKGTPQIYEYELAFPTRDLRHYEARMTRSGPDEVLAMVRDITERKRAEEALRESEESFRSLIANVNDVFIRYGLDLRFCYVDPKLEKILPIRAEDWIGKTHREVGFSEELIEYFDNALIQVRDTGRPVAVEFELDALAGRGFFESISYPEFDAAGAVKSLITVTRDVTGNKRVEDDLRRREEQIRSISNNLPNGLIYQLVRESDEKRRFTYLGDSIRSFYGISAEEGMADASLVYGRILEEDRELLVRTEEDAYRTMSTFKAEARVRNGNGEVRWSSFVSSPRRLDDGTLCWDGIQLDVTERKRTEEALKESEERYRVFAEAAFEGLMIHEKGVIRDANQACAELFGFQDPEELIGRGFFEVLPLTEKAKERVRLQLREVRDIVAEVELLRPDGSIRYLETQGRNFNYKGRPARAVTIRDISDRKRMEEERLKSQRLESIGVLAGGIAHDFNNILTGIMGNISISLMDLERGKTPRSSLEAAEKACGRARDLTGQLLTFSRGGEPVIRPASVKDIVEEEVSFVSRGSNVRCDTTFSADLHPASVDAGQIGQVVHNLVLNAIQAMPGGGVVQIGAENVALGPGNSALLDPGRYVVITVADRGPGIAPERLSKIFDPYFTTKPKGSGLGLATCHSIVNRHRGKITAESVVGKGAVFRVYLPASEAAPETKTEDAPAPLKGKGRILVMDDDKAVREVARLMLESAGYEVAECADGAAAVDVYRKAMSDGSPFTAVIFDLTVPGAMGGKQAIAKILEFDPQVRAIVASGYSEDPVMADCQKYGFAAKAPKPYTIDELTRALAAVLE